MKRPLIITIGILIILLIIGLWAYLMVYGAPKETREVFTNLGFASNSNIPTKVVDVENIQNKGTNLSLTGVALQQLTTRAVAGFGFVGDSNTKIRYVEKGTGHLYEIDTNESTENQISLTTIAKTAEAVFSQNGNSVVLTKYEGYEKIRTIGTVIKKDTAISLTNLPPGTENISFLDDDTLYFTIESNVGTKGYKYVVSKKIQTEIFSTELTDVVVTWGKGITKIHLETKPSETQEGYAYTISKNILTPKKAKGYGLTTLSNNKYTLASIIEDKTYQTLAYSDTLQTKQPILMLKDKCTFDTKKESGVWCASPLTVPTGAYLESWYKGAVTSDDYLWYTDITTQSAQLVGDLKKLSGKIIDVEHLILTNDSKSLLFTNKVDQTLWLYKIEKGN